MNRFGEHEPTFGGAEPSRAALEQRIRDLETENQQLRTDLQNFRQNFEIDRQQLAWFYSLGLPLTEEEARNPGRGAYSLREVLDECEREFGK
jgi:hypothetical protein